MKWELHHVNLNIFNLQESLRFYRDILEFESTNTHTIGTSYADLGYDETNLAVIGDDNRGIHLIQPLPGYARKTGLPINPTLGGHIAFAVSDIKRAKARLVAAGIEVADAGDYAMPGIAQLYFFDPALNMIELNQKID